MIDGSYVHISVNISVIDRCRWLVSLLAFLAVCEARFPSQRSSKVVRGEALTYSNLGGGAGAAQTVRVGVRELFFQPQGHRDARRRRRPTWVMAASSLKIFPTAKAPSSEQPARVQTQFSEACVLPRGTRDVVRSLERRWRI